MNIPKDNTKLEAARRLRRDMTPHERKLWYLFLQKYPAKIYKQRIIDKFIVDFYCASAALVIELDGSQHRKEQGIHDDKIRDDYLNSLGILVLRYSNETIHKNFYGVCADIQRHISSRQNKTQQPPLP